MIDALFLGGLGDDVLHLDPSLSYLKLYKIIRPVFIFKEKMS